MKVVFCVPYLERATDALISSIENCLPAIEADGWEHGLTQAKGNPYISAARAEMTRKALDAGADYIMYLDYDIGFTPETMVKMLRAKEPVIAGTYRFKQDKPEYMGSLLTDEGGGLITHDNGYIKADKAPAGFLKVSKEAVSLFAKAHPQLLYGDPMHPYIDLFNHGAYQGTWWGEDYAFCRRWVEAGGVVWVYPDLDIDHHSRDAVFKGNFHRHLRREDI